MKKGKSISIEKFDVKRLQNLIKIYLISIKVMEYVKIVERSSAIHPILVKWKTVCLGRNARQTVMAILL